MADWGELPPLTLDDHSDIPKYLQVARAIEFHIRAGHVRSNARLPSENELDKLLGLSRSTIRKALEELERLGCIYRKQGHGTFAAVLYPSPAASNGTMFAAEPVISETPGTMPSWLTASSSPSNPTVQKRAGSIGLLVPTMLNEIYPLIIKGVEDVASRRGSNVFICNTYANRDRELTLMQDMIERGVDGIILEPTHARFDQPGTRTFQLLKSFPLPCVLIDNDIPGLELPQVILDDFRGGEVAARHLVDNGHRRLAYVFKETVLAALDRRDGFLATLRSAGIPISNALLVPYGEEDESRNPGYLYTERLLKVDPQPTAIFYFNDELAINGIRAIRDAGLRVPEDISVIGFDNIQSGAAPDVRLTTIEHPKYFGGRWAADILFDQIDRASRGLERIHRRITVHPELVVRSTVATVRH